MAMTQAGPPPVRRVMRSGLGQARGVGSAHAGAHHWSAMRWTSIALLPLTLWFVASVLRLARAGYGQALHWAARPWNAVLLLALTIASFHHLHLGLQAVIEDYVHDRTMRWRLLTAMRAAVALMALACVLSVLVLAMGRPGR